MAYSITGTGGNDTINRSADVGPGTIVGLGGDDKIFTGSGLATVTGGSGNDTVVLRGDTTGTIDAGGDNDSVVAPGPVGAMLLLGGNGFDSINVHPRNRRADHPGRQRLG